MKHVSRVLFGFSIVAVLALFTACPQAADTKKDTPNPNPLGLDQKAAAKLISDLSSISSNFEIDTTSGAITIKKEAAGTITLPKQLSTNPALTLKDAKVTKGTSVTAAKASGDAGFTLTVTKPTANKAEVITIQLTVAGKDKSGKTVDSVFTIVVTNKKDIDEVTPPPAVPVIGEVTAAAGTEDNKVVLKVASVTGDDYTALKITAVKKAGSEAVKIDGAAELLIQKADVASLATGKTVTLSSDTSVTPGEEYTFTFQLMKNADTVGASKTADGNSGKTTPPPVVTPELGEVKAETGTEDNKVVLKVASVTGDDYTALKITAVKKAGSEAVKIDGAAELLIQKADVASLATGKTVTLSSDTSVTPGEEYTFTFQLMKNADTVGASKTADGNSGTN